MVKFNIEDIIFWLIILFIVGVALWLLHGSPTEEGAIISIGMAIVSSEIMIWRKFYCLERKTAISFIKLKWELNENNLRINNKLDNYNIQINNKLDNLSNKLKNK